MRPTIDSSMRHSLKTRMRALTRSIRRELFLAYGMTWGN